MSSPGRDFAVLLAPYAQPEQLPSSSSCGDAHVARQLQRARQAARPSERLTVLLSAAENSFKKEQFALALSLFSASLSLSLSLPSSSSSSAASAASLATTLRRVGECQHAMQEYAAAIAAFQAALSLFSSSSSNLPVQAERSLQALYLSLGNSFLDSGDDESATLTERRQRVLKAKGYHKLSVDSARKLCGISPQPQQEAEAGAQREQAEGRAATAAGGRRRRKEGAMTRADAQLLVRSYVNLANCLAQLLHLDGCEMLRRQRVAAAHAAIAATDSSSSSCSPPTSPSSSSSASAFDPVNSADDELSSLSSSSLLAHRQARFSAAVALLDSAVALCVSYSLQSDLSTALENAAGLYDTAGNASEAKEYWLRQAREAGGGVAAEAEAGLKVMMMQLRHESWDEALQTAARVRTLLQDAGEQEVGEELRLQATEETDWVQEVCDSIRRRDELQRDIAAMQEQNETEEEEEEKDDRDDVSKRRRIASSASLPMLTEEEEDAQFRPRGSQQLQRVERLLRLLHAQVHLCLSLAESNVAASVHHAMAFTAHQQAIATVSSTSCCPPSVIASVHLYHALSISRYLPCLALTQSSAAETRAQLTSARQSLEAAAAAGAGGMRRLLEAQLMFMTGQDGPSTLSLLRSAVEELRSEEGAEEQRVLKAQLLLETLQVLDVMQQELQANTSDSRSWQAEKEAVTAELEELQRWSELHPHHADRQRRWLQFGQFMLQDDDDDDEQQPDPDDEKQQADDADMDDLLVADDAVISFSHEQ